MMLIRESREDMKNSGSSIQYITVTVLSFTSITSKPCKSDLLTPHFYLCQTPSKSYKTQKVKIKSVVSQITWCATQYEQLLQLFVFLEELLACLQTTLHAECVFFFGSKERSLHELL